MFKLFNKMLPGQPPSPVEFAARRCLWERWHSCGCRRCVEVCPSGALRLEAGRISFDRQNCSACMRCCAVCPNDALIATAGLSDLLTEMAGAGELFFSCNRQPRLRAEEYVLPCLGQLTDEALIAITLRGPPSVVFNIAACARCCNGGSATAAIDALERIRHTLRSLVRSKITLLHPGQTLAANETAPSRRDFLAGLTGKVRQRTVKAIGGQPPANPEPINNRLRIPWRRRLLLHVWDSLDEQGRQRLRETCCPQLILNENCALCPRCAGICPSGALRMEGEDDNERLFFDGRLCSSCGLCVAFCPEGALCLKRATLDEKKPAQDRES